MAGQDDAGLFPPASEAEWRRLVERALGGKPYKSLVSATFEGLEIAPLYQRPAADSGHALRQKPGAWKISQRMDHPDLETANAMARADLTGGAGALALTVAGALSGRGFGVDIESGHDLSAALSGIELDLISLRLDAGVRALGLAPFFVSIAKERGLTSATLDVDFGYDPAGQLARSGALAADYARDLRETRVRLRDAGFAGHFFLADGRPYHEAGAGEAQELACVIATGVEYLRLLESEGLPLQEARREIAILLAADADEFMCLAKFRALRRLWARVETACGLEPQPLRLHAETSFRMMTRYDPWVNILRAAMGTFAAGVGGADTITALPFTLALGLPDEFARRIARNTQLILIHEAKLAIAADPAAGAGSFEALTDELCARAWDLFQSFEARGGMIAALRAGLPQSEISASAAARREAIAQRSLLITGTSAFPLLAEAPVNVLAASPAEAGEHPPGSLRLSLLSRRDAEPFEVLRRAADERYRDTGVRPRIFLAKLGPPPSHATASIFAANFFAAAGIEAVSSEGFEEALAASVAFRASGCKIACVCAPDGMASQPLIEFARALSAAGARRLYLGRREQGEAVVTALQVMVNEFHWTHRSALAILQDATATVLCGQPS
ncbi:MAG: methylmalonyl-CoA mutase subunit beta [Beijerinckiaceae bacterium]|nr:methylmalonyl-CoA mutase subunit beta [Beijerinckiaceae bacterium]